VPQHSSLQSALQQQLAASAALGGYGKLIGAGSPGMSSHRYSPYSLPSFNSGAAMAGLANHPQLAQQLAAQSAAAAQYSVSSPLMSQPATSQAQGGQMGAGSQAGLPTLDSQQQGTTMPPQGMMASPYPGYSLANIPGVDWSSLGYSLPAMYSLPGM